VEAPLQEELARRERAGDWAGILALAEAGLAGDPDSLEWLTIRAHALARLARWPAAADAFRRVLAREPHEIEPWLLLAHAERMAGRRADALRTLERSLQVTRESPVAWTMLGDLWLEARDAGRARAAYREALRLDPESAPARAGLVRAD